MWNSTFNPKSGQPMKRTPLNRSTSQMSRTGFKRPDFVMYKGTCQPYTPSSLNSRPNRTLKRGSMTSTIPTKLRAEMALDPFYKRCVITGKTDEEAGEKIQWHHNLEFKGKRVNRKFCILPLLESIHDAISQHKEKVDWIMWNRASDEEIQEFSKAVDYKAVRARLNNKFKLKKQCQF